VTQESITLSKKSLNRLHVIRNTDQGLIRQAEAARQLNLSTRQIKRLLVRYRQQGPAGLISRHIGRPGNHRLSAAVRDQAVMLIRSHYHDFGPTLAREKLRERHDLMLSVESTRQLMMAAGLWRSRTRKAAPYHPRRERRARRGELIQIDGSPHDWFEGRAPACTLLVFIDDATGALMHLRFVAAETTEAYMTALRSYLQLHGRPVALYSDCHSVFRVNCEEPGLTQFGRALDTLQIEAIHATSPQAKGRVERANQTLQDRLVKELRLQGINDWQAGNDFLKTFKSDFNQRFAVTARDPEDAHREVLHSAAELDLVLARHTRRQISKDLEVQYHNRIYQIQCATPGYTMQRAKLTVCETFDGEVVLLYKGRRLPYTVLGKEHQQRQRINAKQLNQVVDNTRKPTAPYKPKANHPWRTMPIAPSRASSPQPHALTSQKGTF
jgi:hypothetical protein